MSVKRLTLKESWNSLTKSLFFFSRENVEAYVYYWSIEGLMESGELKKHLRGVRLAEQVVGKRRDAEAKVIRG